MSPDLAQTEESVAKIASLEHEVADLRSRLAQRKTTMDKAYDQLGDIIGDLRHGSALCVMLSEIRASLD